MDRILADTNVLLRSVEPEHPSHVSAVTSLVVSTRKYGRVCVLPQNLIEFWNVATRPVESNGLGWSVTETAAELSRFETIFEVLPDAPAIYSDWKELVKERSVLGKQVHDAGIVAAMNVHNISTLLSFNLRDFKRFGHLTLIDPDAFLNSDDAVEE